MQVSRSINAIAFTVGYRLLTAAAAPHPIPGSAPKAVWI